MCLPFTQCIYVHFLYEDEGQTLQFSLQNRDWDQAADPLGVNIQFLQI